MMTPKQFIAPFQNEDNIKNQAKLILKGAGLGLLKPKFYKVDEEQIKKEAGTFSGNDVGKLGLPIFDSFIFNCDSVNKITYTASKEFGGNNVSIEEPFYFDTALIDVSQTKNIVKTSIAGLNGTVKEYMSEGDFVINLKGVIVGDVANQRPDIDKLNSLVEYLKAPTAIPITSRFLNEWNINSVVVESYKVGQREGSRNIIDIEINMLSDDVIELSSTGGSKPMF